MNGWMDTFDIETSAELDQVDYDEYPEPGVSAIESSRGRLFVNLGWSGL